MSSDPWSVMIVTDTSIKSQVTTLISCIHSYNRPIIKIVHHAINIMTTKAELCAIRCDINQAIHLSNINKIFVITDSIHAARRIFDLLSYLY